MRSHPARFQTIRRRVVLDRSPFLRVEDHEVRLPDGRVIPDWAWVETPEFVSVLAVTEAGRFLFFRQRKYALRGDTLAPPGGYLEPGERPAQAARRELREETGYGARRWHSLGRFRVDTNRGAGMAHLFLALGARRISEPHAGDLEPQVLLEVPRRDLEAALDKGQFKGLPWVALVALGLRRLDRMEKNEPLTPRRISGRVSPPDHPGVRKG